MAKKAKKRRKSKDQGLIPILDELKKQGYYVGSVGYSYFREEQYNSSGLGTLNLAPPVDKYEDGPESLDQKLARHSVVQKSLRADLRAGQVTVTPRKIHLTLFDEANTQYHLDIYLQTKILSSAYTVALPGISTDDGYKEVVEVFESKGWAVPSEKSR